MSLLSFLKTSYKQLFRLGKKIGTSEVLRFLYSQIFTLFSLRNVFLAIMRLESCALDLSYNQNKDSYYSKLKLF